MSKSIAGDMAAVNTAVADIRQGGEQVEASTTELSKLAEQLKATVGQFKVYEAPRHPRRFSVNAPRGYHESVAARVTLPPVGWAILSGVPSRLRQHQD